MGISAEKELISYLLDMKDSILDRNPIEFSKYLAKTLESEGFKQEDVSPRTVYSKVYDFTDCLMKVSIDNGVKYHPGGFSGGFYYYEETKGLFGPKRIKKKSKYKLTVSILFENDTRDIINKLDELENKILQDFNVKKIQR